MASAALDIADLEVSYGDTPVLHKVSLAVGRGRVRRPPRPLGLRQDHAAARGIGLRTGRRGTHRGRRPRHHAAAAGPARHGDGVPVVRALAAHDDRAEPRLRPEAAPGARADIATRVAEISRMLKLEGFGERNVTQLSGGQRQRVALGRALAIEPGAAAAGRAALQPRRAHPRGGPPRDQGPASEARHHHASTSPTTARKRW